MKAIETVYNGYRFRSRLEARWAVFFDTLGIRYEYEKEGYDLDGVWYLPDFWLPDLGYWIEIKGQEPTEEEHAKALALAEASNTEVYLFAGSIEIPDHDDEKMLAYQHGGSEPWDVDEFAWCECPFCRSIGLALFGDIDW